MWVTLSSLKSVSFLEVVMIALLWLQRTWKQTAVLESFWRKSFKKEKWLAKGHVMHIEVQFSSVGQSCPTLWDYSTPGFPVHQQLLELTQTHVHRVGDAIQPSHPLSVILFSSCLQSFPASGSFPMSEFFPSGGQSIGTSASASVLPMNIQDWFPLGLTGLISLQSKRLSIRCKEDLSCGFILSLWRLQQAGLRSTTTTHTTLAMISASWYSYFCVNPSPWLRSRSYVLLLVNKA